MSAEDQPSEGHEATPRADPSSGPVLPTCIYVGSRAPSLCVGAATLVAGLYVVAQWWLTRAVGDAPFVGLLLGATTVLFLALRALFSFIVREGLEFFAFSAGRAPARDLAEFRRFLPAVFDDRRMSLWGVLYGAALGQAPWLLGVWTDHSTLQGLLSVFLFSINFPAGVALYALLTFFRKSLSLVRLVEVDLWQTENASTEFFYGSAKRIALSASLYISICQSSILFSLLPLNRFVLGYAIFAGILLLASLVLPVVPIIRKSRLVKRQALRRVGTQLQEEFAHILDESRARQTDISLARLDHLIALRRTIEQADVWPFRVRLLTSALSVAVLTAFPVVLQVLLQKYFQ